MFDKHKDSDDFSQANDKDMLSMIDSVETPEEKLVNTVKLYNRNCDTEKLQRAIDFAIEYHGSQKRASGEPYYYHPIAVAQIVADLHLDSTSVITALLHDTVEDTEATIEQIEELFGKKIADMVNGVTKIEKIQFRTQSEKQAENFRKFLIAISEDIRILIVKLADRLHNMQTLHFIKKPEKRIRIAKETMDIYIPLAERIGMHVIKTKLQDISFRELHSDAYESIVNRLEYLRKENKGLIKQTVSDLEQILALRGVKAKISGREKMPYSIWMKMQVKGLSFENVTDINAFRIITDTVEDAYLALCAIHVNYHMLPGYFEDYISVPKENGYQSIHTIIMGKDRQKIEVQIRTKEMHEVAEFGLAAHWAYKQNINYSADGEHYKWVQKLLDVIDVSDSPDELLENAKLEMYHDRVFCFTPQGNLIVLPKHATPVDFAFAVHTDIGKTCAGAKVNGKLVPLRTKLRNGDQVEIMQAKVPTITPSWEGFVKTGKAVSEIRRYFKQKKREEYLKLGRSLFDKICLQNDREINDEELLKLLPLFKKKTISGFFIAVGEKKISRVDLLNKLFPDAKIAKRYLSEGEGYNVDEQVQIPIAGLTEGVSIKFASCCHPLPGEKIVGIQSSESSPIIVHANNCQELEAYVSKPEEWIDLKWDDNQTKKYRDKFLGRLTLIAANQRGALFNISGLCMQENADIHNLRIDDVGQDFCHLVMDVEVKDVNHLERLAAALKRLDVIHKVKMPKGSI